MLTLYRRFWGVHWAEQWQYRANLVMYLLYWLVSPIVYMSVWMSVASARGDVGGMKAADFAAYYLMALAVSILTSNITIHILAPKIEDGTMSGWLLMPVHPVLTQTLMNNLAFKLLQVFAMIPVWALLYWLFQPAIQLSLINVLLAVPALVLAFAIQFLLGAVITFVAFWTTRVWALQNVYWAVNMLFSGEFIPLNLLPSGLQAVSRVLPFQLTLFFPIQLLLGHVPVQEALVNIGLQVFWCVPSFILFTVMWRAGLKRFSAVGA